MNQITWKKTTATISLKQERLIGFFKKKYSVVLSYYTTAEQAISDEEMERIYHNKGLIKTLENNLAVLDKDPNFIGKDSFIVQKIKDTNTVRRLYVQELELTKAVFEKYKNAQKLSLQYNIENPNSIKISIF